MNKEVSFPIAKLLKEKGFDLPTQKYYEHALKSVKNREDGYSGPFGWKKGELNLQTGYFVNSSKTADLTSEMWYMCSAPTIADVVMWLYEKHGIWISVNATEDLKSFWYEIRGVGRIWFTGKNCNSPTEAYEAAIEYTLNNLIKKAK